MLEPAVLLGIAIIGLVTSASLHAIVQRYWLASVLAGLIGSAIYQFAAFLRLGHLDPFFLVGFIVGAGVFFAVAMLVGLAFSVRRRR